MAVIVGRIRRINRSFLLPKKNFRMLESTCGISGTNVNKLQIL